MEVEVEVEVEEEEERKCGGEERRRRREEKGRGEVEEKGRGEVEGEVDEKWREKGLAGFKIWNPAQQFCGAWATYAPQNCLFYFFYFAGKFLIFKITFFLLEF